MDAGAGPAAECVGSMVGGVPSVNCIAGQVTAQASSAAGTAAADVFKVGLFSGFAPLFLIPMSAYGVWNILKSEIKILLQFEMAVSNVFSKIWKWFTGPIKRFLARRKRWKSRLVEMARKQQQSTEKPLGDVVDGSDIDALGIPGRSVSAGLPSPTLIPYVAPGRSNRPRSLYSPGGIEMNTSI
eukprot:GHVT01010561.1.p1 GENE.GHVT01010561.1~~GHVT01010561.1.p1  ORF type:complete len:184 (-),score=17.86 GHVT01010561.1:432-983(-)